MELSDDAPVHGGRCIFRPFRSVIRRRGRVNQNLIEAVHKSKDDLFSPWIDVVVAWHETCIDAIQDPANFNDYIPQIEILFGGKRKRPVSRSANKPRIEEEGRCVWNGESSPSPFYHSFHARIRTQTALPLSLFLSLSLSTGNKKSGERVLSRVCLIVIAVSSGHERKNRAIVRGAPVTSLPRGGARITHVFVRRWGGGGGGGERKHFFRKWTPA